MKFVFTITHNSCAYRSLMLFFVKSGFGTGNYYLQEEQCDTIIEKIMSVKKNENGPDTYFVKYKNK